MSDMLQFPAGRFIDGMVGWQHPSTALYSLPEAGGLQEPGSIAKQSPLPAFTPTGLNSQQGAQA